MCWTFRPRANVPILDTSASSKQGEASLCYTSSRPEVTAATSGRSAARSAIRGKDDDQLGRATSGGKDDDHGGLRVGARMMITEGYEATSGGKDDDHGGLRVGAKMMIKEGYEWGQDDDHGGLRVGARMMITEGYEWGQGW
ncbi:hypothetical protein Bbelb_149720 [Branchiostoma belcheri]|nr:hypothetical protein Bbelb_149720 [Branchiostoma belcheri]